MSSIDKNCTVLLFNKADKKIPPNQDEILKGLESHKIPIKIQAVKDAILALVNGESLPKVLMHIVRFCSTNEDHQLKKLLMIFWEVVQKYDSNQKLLPEMILVCNALLNDLNHPNEYIRGCMLRFLCKIKEPEILEPLKDAIKSNLEHRHSYVRRHAVMTVFMCYKNFGELLIPDAPDLIEQFITTESDVNARRNAFLMLFECAEDKAITFLMNNMDQVGKFGNGFSLIILELTRKVCLKDPTQKSRFIRCIFSLLNSSSSAVSYEAAWTLVTLSSAPTAIRAAASTYCGLLNGQSDNNLKLIVLDRIEDLKKYHLKVLQEILMDIMRAMSSPSLAISEKVLNITMDLVSPRNIEEVVSLLKREVIKTQDKNMDTNSDYRKLLVKSIHSCAVKFPGIANQVVNLLMNFLNSDGAMNVILFVREMCESYPEMRTNIIETLIFNLPDISRPNVCRAAIWILGEYTESMENIQGAFSCFQSCLGDVPFTGQDVDENPEDSSDTSLAKTLKTKSVVLSDGTYATETVYDTHEAQSPEGSLPEMRKLILAGDFYFSTVLATTLTKLCLRAVQSTNKIESSAKSLIIDTLIYLTAIINFGCSHFTKIRIDEHSKERIALCIHVLANPDLQETIGVVLLSSCRKTFSTLINNQKQLKASLQTIKTPQSQVDDLISFRQLRGKKALGSTDIDIDDGADINRAIGGGGNGEFSGKLKDVHQLCGLADPVYAEAYLTVHDYDIILDILIINRTPQTLNNLTAELSTVGDLKIVDRPQSLTIGPLDVRTIRVNIKVSSTESSYIYGTIVFESASGAEKTYVNLNHIYLDIMDYIVPATCGDTEFRKMWAEFEWENKVAVNTEMNDIIAFCNHIIEYTNMRSMSPIDDSNEETDFLAVNLYAKSIFGEDALVNLSVERQESGKISGYIRIRSKTQGIALSLGDRMTLVQRGKSDKLKKSKRKDFLSNQMMN